MQRIVGIKPAHIAAAVIFVAGIDIIFVLRTDLEKTAVDQITVNIQLKAWFAVLVQLYNQFLFRLSLVDNTIPKAKIAGIICIIVCFFEHTFNPGRRNTSIITAVSTVTVATSGQA